MDLWERLSNPVKRRLSGAEIEQLIHQYRDGASIEPCRPGIVRIPKQPDELVAAYLARETVNDLARQFGVHRTTVMAHVKRREAKRPTMSAKCEDEMLGATLRVKESSLGAERVSSRRRSSAVAGSSPNERCVSSTNRAELQDRSRSSP